MENTDYFDSVLQRVKDVAAAGTDVELAKMLGMSPQALNNRKKSRSLPNTEIVDFCNKQLIDLNFVYRGSGSAGGDTLRAAMTEIQAWQVREQRFLPPAKFVEAVFSLCEIAEDKPERVKPAAAMVLRLVA